MPAVQTSYSETQRIAVAGMIADMTRKSLISRTVENAAGVAFGAGVCQGVDDRGCHTITVGDTAATFVGVCARERSLVAEGNLIPRYESARIMRIGSIWVVASVDVVAGDIVHFIAATGAWAKTGGQLVPNARWDTSALATNLAVLTLNLPG